MAPSTQQSETAPSSCICEFVEARDASVRLRNSLRSAKRMGSLPHATVADYLAAVNPRADLMRSVRNFGLRTANELDRMVRRSRDATTPIRDPADPVPTPIELASATDLLKAALEGASLRDELTALADGGRIERLLASDLGERCAWRCVSALPELLNEVTLVPAVGATTREDLRRALRLLCSTRLRDGGIRSAVRKGVLAAIFGVARGTQQDGPDDQGDGTDHVALLRDLLAGLTVGEAFSSEVIDVRLQRLVSNSSVATAQIADALLDRAGWTARLRRFDNTGRTTVSKFWDVCVRRLAAASARLDDDARTGLAAVLGLESDRLEAREDDVLALAVSMGEEGGEASRNVPIPTELAALVGFLLERVRDQDAGTIRRRFGLDGASPETLEEIGTDVGVTRERIRQLEKRGLRDLAVQARRVDLRRAIDDHACETWRELAGTDDTLMRADLHAARRRLAGEFVLALELSAEGLESFLDRTATGFRHGWLRPGGDGDAVRALAGRVSAAVLPCLPCLVADLGIEAPSRQLEAALRVELGMHVHRGYAIAGRLSARARLTVSVHATLAAYRTPLSASDLLAEYRTRDPQGCHSHRQLSTVMGDAPHLFLEVTEQRWVALGLAGSVPARWGDGAIHDEEEEEEEAAQADGGLASVLVDELKRNGPQALARLTDNPRRWLPRDWSVNSIGATLILRPDLFVRFLPGVYGLPHQLPGPNEIAQGEVPYLLDPQQVRLLALARRADEPWGAYPVWTPEAEMRLCRWAYHAADGDELRSLLAVADVEAWPADPEQKALWRERQRREARFDLLATLRQQAVESRPVLHRVLAALMEIETVGRTSWMALNRVDGRRIDAHSGCALLATLVLLGAVANADPDAECPWQLPHATISPVAREVRSRLADELHRTGRLDWSSDLGMELQARIRDAEGAAPSWLDFRAFRACFDAVPDGAAQGGKASDAKDPVAIGARLLADRRMADVLEWMNSR